MVFWPRCRHGHPLPATDCLLCTSEQISQERADRAIDVAVERGRAQAQRDREAEPHLLVELTPELMARCEPDAEAFRRYAEGLDDDPARPN